MESLTPRQKDVLDFIRERQLAQGIPPTIREVAAHFGFSSPNAAMIHVRALQEKGYLKSAPGLARTLQVVEPGDESPVPRVAAVPIYGSIPAGPPEQRTQEEEGCLYIDVETLGGIKPTARTFGLRVRGDSMVGRHIVDGDIAVIEHGVQPRHGDVVAALIDGQVTLKTFIMQRGKPFLRAENPKYPNPVPQNELQIQGVMTALVRKRK